MENRLPEMYVVIEGTKFQCVVTDTCVHLGFMGGETYGHIPSVVFRPFETSVQALQRVYPGCLVYVGNLLVNSPGNREWIA